MPTKILNRLTSHRALALTVSLSISLALCSPTALADPDQMRARLLAQKDAEADALVARIQELPPGKKLHFMLLGGLPMVLFPSLARPLAAGCNPAMLNPMVLAPAGCLPISLLNSWQDQEERQKAHGAKKDI